MVVFVALPLWMTCRSFLPSHSGHTGDTTTSIISHVPVKRRWHCSGNGPNPDDTVLACSCVVHHRILLLMPLPFQINETDQRDGPGIYHSSSADTSWSPCLCPALRQGSHRNRSSPRPTLLEAPHRDLVRSYFYLH